MGNVTFTVGCPGAGKSTYAEARVYHGWQKLCLDDFRAAIWGSKQLYWQVIGAGGPEAETAKAVLGTVYSAAFSMLTASDGNVIVANCHLGSGEGEFLEARKSHNARLVVFTLPFDELLTRNNERPEDDRVSEDYLRQCFAGFNAPGAWWRKYPDAIEWRS